LELAAHFLIVSRKVRLGVLAKQFTSRRIVCACSGLFLGEEAEVLLPPIKLYERMPLTRLSIPRNALEL